MSLENLFNRQPPTTWEQFWSSPLIFFATRIHRAFAVSPSLNHTTTTIRIVCISDTHNAHNSLPPLPAGDVLIHAGDLSQHGSPREVNAVLGWMSAQPHTHKIFIAGNHDRCLDDPSYQSTLESSYPDVTYLQDSSVSLAINGRTIKFFGSPQTPRYGSWPFQYPRIAPAQVSSSARWSSVPMDTDVLITHGPPAHHLDSGHGCLALLGTLWRLRPKLHVFGHIHEGRGVETVAWTDGQLAYERIVAGLGGWIDLWTVWRSRRDSTRAATVLVNAAAVCGVFFEKINGAIVVDI